MSSMPRFGKDAKTIAVTVGSRFVIELPVQATAGYSWRIARVPDVVELCGERVVPSGAAAGASAVQEFELRAIHSGKGELSLEYKRSWEHDALERRGLTVIVSELSSVD